MDTTDVGSSYWTLFGAHAETVLASLAHRADEKSSGEASVDAWLFL